MTIITRNARTTGARRKCGQRPDRRNCHGLKWKLRAFFAVHGTLSSKTGHRHVRIVYAVRNLVNSPRCSHEACNNNGARKVNKRAVAIVVGNNTKKCRRIVTKVCRDEPVRRWSNTSGGYRHAGGNNKHGKSEWRWLDEVRLVLGATRDIRPRARIRFSGHGTRYEQLSCVIVYRHHYGTRVQTLITITPINRRPVKWLLFVVPE